MQYNQDEIDTYWNDIKETMITTHTNLIKPWCADNNGEIAQDESRECVGNWAVTKTQIPEDGGTTKISPESTN